MLAKRKWQMAEQSNMVKVNEMVQGFVASQEYTNTTIHYDMDAIRIRLYESYSDKRCLFFYVYTPWRITQQGRIINSSELYSEDSKEAFSRYTESTRELCKQRITDVTIKPGSFDISLKWDDGTILESFNLEADEDCYHIYDNLNGVVYDVRYGNIVSWVAEKGKLEHENR
jgi:hypothetical protein